MIGDAQARPRTDGAPREGGAGPRPAVDAVLAARSGDGAPAEAADAGPRGEVVRLLLGEGLLSEAALRHAERVQAKLARPRALLPLLQELGSVDPERLRATLRRHRLELRIGSLLLDLGCVSPEQLAHALAVQAAEEGERKLGEILVACGFLGGEELAQVLGEQLGVPVVAPAALDPDPTLVAQATLARCRRHRFLPLAREGAAVHVVFADPLDKDDASQAQAAFGPEVVPLLASPVALDAALSRLELAERAAREGAEGATASAVLREMLAAALADGASAVHLEPGARTLDIRLRRDGVLWPWRELPLALAPALVRCLELEAGIEPDAGAPHRTGTLRFERGGVHDVSVDLLATPDGESALLRLRPPDDAAPALAGIGLLPGMRRRLEEQALDVPGALLLLAGPAGSGCTTTLVACVRHLASTALRVVVVADRRLPRIDGVTRHLRVTPGAPPPAESVAAALAQDPDVLALDAVHDGRDLAAAAAAARHGARVLAVVRAEDAAAALQWAASGLAPGGEAPGLLRGALAQRLVRGTCPECAAPQLPEPAILRRLGSEPVELAGGRFRRGRGCGRCADSGHAGRTGVFELLLLDETAREGLRRDHGAEALRRAAGRFGPATLLEDGLVKAARGLTSLEECLRVLPRHARPRPLAELERRMAEEEA